MAEEIQAQLPKFALFWCETWICVTVAVGLLGALPTINQTSQRLALVQAWQQDLCLGMFTLALHFIVDLYLWAVNQMHDKLTEDLDCV